MGFMDKVFGKNKEDYAQEFKDMIENKETINDGEYEKFSAFIEKWVEADFEDANSRYATIILGHKNAAYKNFSNFDVEEVKGTISALMENAGQLSPTNKKLAKWYKTESEKIFSQVYSLYGINDSDWLIRKKATESLDDQERLASIAKNDSNESVRGAAVQRLDNQDVLEDIAKNEWHVGVRCEAIKKVNNPDVLRYVSENDSDKVLRDLAKGRLDDIG